MSTDEPDSDLPEFDPSPSKPTPASVLAPVDRPGNGSGPLGDLPRIARRHARLGMRLSRAEAALLPMVDELSSLLGTVPRFDRAEIIPRASGLRRPGAIALFGWPRLGSRVGLGIEPAIAHAIVDRLLGFERSEPEHKLQVSPVEWGVLGFVVARLLDRLANRPGALGPWDLYIDRVGPEPFQPDGLGPIVTLAWPLQIGPASGIVRLWVPEVLIALALVDEPLAPGTLDDHVRRFGALIAAGRAEAGTIVPPGGFAGIRIGKCFAISGDPPRGTPAAPEGPIGLAFGDDTCRWVIPSAFLPNSGGARLTVTGPIARTPRPQEATPVPPSTDSSASIPETAAPVDVPVTLVVELGRLSLPLARLADLKPGDVLELSRRSSDPVDLTSGGTLLARGELVQVDAGLGVRITRMFL